MASWYVSSVAYTGMTAWAASTAYNIGDIRKRLTGDGTYPNARVFRCTTAGTSGASEPTWVLTKGATTTDNTVVWTEVTGNETYGWSAASPYFELIAESWCAAGDIIYVSHQHSETVTVATTITVPGTLVAPVIVLCVNDGASPPTALATTASWSTSGTATLTMSGSFYIYGMVLRPGSEAAVNATLGISSSGTTSQRNIFESCDIRLASGTSTTLTLGVGANGTYDHIVKLINTKIKFNGSGGRILLFRVNGEWNGGELSSGSINTVLIATNVGYKATMKVSGVDLSVMSGASKYLVNSNSTGADITFCGCKLASSKPTVINTALQGEGSRVYVEHCDNGAVTSVCEYYAYPASQILSTATYRTGGATDGLNAHSYNITTLAAGVSFINPFRSKPVYRWLATTGTSKTVTIHILHDSITPLKNDEVWAEVEYLGTSGNPMGVFASDSKSGYLATGVNQATSTEAWTHSMSNPNYQKLDVTFTNTLAGYYCVKVCVAVASRTIFFCPKIEVV